MAVISKVHTFTTNKVLMGLPKLQYSYGVTTTSVGKLVCDLYKAENSAKNIMQRVYFRRETSKNVPFLPSKHKAPLPYLVDTQVSDGPGLILRNLYVESDGDNKLGCGGKGFPASITPSSNPAGLPASYLLPSSSTKNAAIAKMHDKIEDQKTIHSNYAVFAGEFSKSLTMISQNVTDVLKCVKNLKKGKFSEAYSALFGRKRRTTYDPLHQKWRYTARKDKRTADALWLEWTYGWSPLIGETFDIIDDLRGREAKFLVRATGRAQETDDGTYEVTTAGSIGRSTVTTTFTVKQRRTVDLRYTCWYYLTNQYWSDLTAAGIHDPASVVWELVPFSFVADWFVNVGDYLRAQTIGKGWTFQYGCESMKQTLNASVVHGAAKSFGAKFQGYERWRGEAIPVFKRSWSRFTRTVLNKPPTMTLSINAKIHSLNRIISSAALLKQLSRR